MKAIIRICVLLAVLLPMQAVAITPVVQKPENLIIRALWTEDRLWLLSSDGQLFSLTAQDRLLTLEYAVDGADDKAVGICTYDGHVEILTEPWNRTGNWAIRHQQNGTWQTDVSFPDDGWYGMACDARSIYLVDERDLLTFENGKLNRLPLSEPLNSGPRLYLLGDSLYAASYPGPRGGLARIDRQTGNVAKIDDATAGLCSGQSNGRCEAVNDVTASPWKSGCILAAVGKEGYPQTHANTSGRLLNICDDRVSLLYAGNGTNNREGTDTIAFWHLLAGKENAYAAASDGLHLIHADGQIETLPMPGFKLFGPLVAYGDSVVPWFRTEGNFAVNFDNPDVIIVLPSPNQRREGGDTPLLVPRR